MRGGIQTKAGNPQLQPKDNDIFDLFDHRGRGQIEIGFMAVKHMAKILPGFVIPRPDALFDAGKHGRRIVIIAICPQIIVAERRAPAAPRLLKPGVSVGGVLDLQFNNNLHA